MAERKTSQTQRNTPPTPEGFVPSQTAPGDTTAADQAQEKRDQALRDQVDASTLEAAPKDQRGPRGDSFYNPATVGSGTIMPDGTYGAPLPDPNVERLAELEREAEDSDTGR